MSSDPKVEEIRTLRKGSVEHWSRPDSHSAYRHLFREIGDGFDYVLTKLDEAEAKNARYDELTDMLADRDAAFAEYRATEERERTLIAGVREAIRALDLVDVYQYELGSGSVGDIARILSRLLPSTPTEEGKKP